MAATKVATKVSILLYTESGAKTQMATTPGVKDIQKNWWLLNKDYATNGQLAESMDGLEDLLKDINAGIPFKKDQNYPYQYGTPTGETVGTYLEVLDRDKAIVPQLENDIARNLQPILTEFGFVISSDNRNALPKLYQSITLIKAVAS